MHDVIVIGASAGGIEAIRQITRALGPKLKAAVFVVVHIAPESSGLLPNILNRRSSIRAHQALDREAVRTGEIYVAPPDRHMILDDDLVRVTNGPKHNRHRPSIDLLFRTAARTYGDRVIGVILTGFLDDGSSGLLAIKNAGGLAIVQSPEDAEVASMPRNALQTVHPDYCVPLAQIAGLLNQLTEGEMEPMVARHAANGHPAKQDVKSEKSEKRKPASGFTCPDCGGAIWEIEENGEVRYECRIGHAYSPDGFSEANDDSVERSLWAALRALEESAALEQRLADLAADRKRSGAHKMFSEKAHDRKQHAGVLREFLMGSKKRQTEMEGAIGKEDLEQVS
ncbi:MAG TPA: chemotaxis protein CheB [Terriglobales bacterium]|nr:chemotaxis protein CheB [Terriglobales bacterium]